MSPDGVQEKEDVPLKGFFVLLYSVDGQPASWLARFELIIKLAAVRH